jgi:hypothetical protein
MHDYYSETSLRASFGNVQLNEMMKPSSHSAGRDGLTLDFAPDRNDKRSRIVSLSDLALEALSPIYSTAIIDGAKTGSQLMTPTPTQFLFPRSVTAEQEAYASGFALALEEIYRTQGRPAGSDVVTTAVGGCEGQHSAASSLTNGLMTTAGNCGVWQPAAVNHTSTLHYIPESSVTSSAAPFGQHGVVANTQYNGSGARLDYGTSLTTSYQPSLPAFNPQSIPLVKAMASSMSSSTQKAAFINCTSSDQMRNSVHCTVNDIMSRTVPCFTPLVNSVPSSSPLSSFSAGSCLSNAGNLPSATCVTAVSTNMFIPMMSASNSFSSLATGESCRVSSTESLHSSISSSGTSPQLAVDMQEQDRWRLERKRAKNRVAAARCQMRKLERIAKLEDKARDLRNYNAQLSQTAAALHEHVAKLQKQILSHTERGCRLLIPSLQ